MGNYLYNGREAPYLPDYDAVAYPHLVMTVATKSASGVSVGDISLCLSPYPLMFNGSNVVMSGAPERTKYLLYRYSPSNGDTEFSLKGEYSGGTANKVTYPSGEDAFWTNHDILNEDGSVYLAASEPVPVLAPTINPLSMWMGWKAGNWVARQRGKKKPATGVYDDTMPIEWKMQDVANNKKIPYVTYQIYSYNGYEFGAPAIDADSDCKYHIIHKYENGYYYTCTNKPFMYTEDNNKYAEIKESLKRIVYVCSGDDIGFVHNDDLADSGLRVLWDNIIWTNTDISDADGTVRMAATEPVYVREQVTQELIKVSNYIPTDEMINNHAISIQSDGDEVVLSSPYAATLDDEGNIVVVLFMDFEVGLAVFMYYFKQECIFEGQAFEPGLYYADSIPSMYPPDTKFKFYIPDEM